MAAASYDINHAPPGGFLLGGWYWDPKAGQARRWTGTTFGPPGVTVPVGSEPGANANSNGPVNPLQAVNDVITKSFSDLQDEVRQRFGDYTAGNPFRVDQVLADKTKEAKEQIDPYYDQQLGDYLLGAQTKINRGNNDTQDFLKELNSSTDSYSEQTKNNLSDAMDQADQGFANNGLLGSGDQISAEGKLTQNSNSNLSDYMRKADFNRKQAVTGNQRNIEDIGFGTRDYTTNLEQNRSTDINTRAATLTKESGQKYIQGFQSTLPTQLQSASGFDMLKSLGIYS